MEGYVHIKIRKSEAKILLASMRAFEETARADEPHWSYQDDFKVLKKRIKEFAEWDKP